MTMHKVLHPRNDIDRPYMSSKKEWRKPAAVEDSMDTSIRWFEDYFKN